MILPFVDSFAYFVMLPLFIILLQLLLVKCHIDIKSYISRSALDLF